MPRQQWPEYEVALDIVRSMHPGKIGETPTGAIWGWWPFSIEEYISDQEPVIPINHPQRAPLAIIRWQRVTRTDIPSDWKQVSNKIFHIEGFSDLEGKDQYQKHWSESARRNFRKWQEYEKQGYAIVPITYSEFKEAYKRSPVARHTHGQSIHCTEYRVAAENKHLDLWGVKWKDTIIAGLSVTNSPSTKSSYYLSGFIHTQTQHIPTMVGLMHHWHVESARRKIRFLHFGFFWCPGRPRNWRGFSNFKSKFGLTYINYPPALYKIRFKFRNKK